MDPAGRNPLRCAACEDLHYRCSAACIFAPYFPGNDQGLFARVKRLYGMREIRRVLKELPEPLRSDEVRRMIDTANTRQQQQQQQQQQQIEENNRILETQQQQQQQIDSLNLMVENLSEQVVQLSQKMDKRLTTDDLATPSYDFPTTLDDFPTTLGGLSSYEEARYVEAVC